MFSPGDLPAPGIEPGSPAWRADALPSEPPGKIPEMLPTAKTSVAWGPVPLGHSQGKRRGPWEGLTCPQGGEELESSGSSGPGAAASSPQGSPQPLLPQKERALSKIDGS